MVESINLYDEFDFNSFLKRRGLRVIIGLIIIVCIVLIHLSKL